MAAMSTPKIIINLRDRFFLHKESYKAASYNETQLRREFIDPFCKALGWDIDNEQGYAEAYKDVVHEAAIKFDGSTKSPDYAFRIGGTRKFFLEAKKPAVNIKSDISSAYQLRRYAWSGKLPLSILTNFDEFAVYDCRVKPEKTDKASIARVSYYTYENYAEKWDEIAAIFSRDAILKGSFDKHADDNKRKRGTAEVDEVFLQEIESWRENLARNIALRNPGLPIRELNTAVQRTIDRVIFLRIAEDRGIETYGRLQGLKDGKNVYTRLTQFFQQADDRYNSGLFHFKKGDGSAETLDTFTLNLAIDDKVLKDIIKSLYYPDSPYEFSVLPADILGQVYEQFLGKVIRLSGRKAVVEEKPEVIKAGGVYYTPTYIVRYIVENAIEPFLRNSTPAELSGQVRRAKDATPFRILDPACGSGSFLIEAYQYLLNWYRDQYIADCPEKHARGREPRLYQAHKRDWRLTIAERRRILLTHIYGVDIDSQAVEVTKLSLLLKALEGETGDEIARQMDFFHMRALPDLGANIRCGNSLISEEFYKQYQLGLFNEEQIFRINTFDWSEFDFFTKSSGFDVVMGNPPYGANLYDEEKGYFKKKYTSQSYQLDSYLLFVERSISLLMRDGGMFGMIIPNPWLTNLNQTALREYVISHAALNEIVHFHFPVFARAKAVVDTEIVLFRKEQANNNVFEAKFVRKLASDGRIKTFDTVIQHSQSAWSKRVGQAFNIFLDDKRTKLANKIFVSRRRFDEFFKINVGMKPYQVGKGKPAQVRFDVENRIFDSEKNLDHTYRQYLRGADIESFIVAPQKKRFIKYGVWLAEPRPAANFDADAKILVRQTGDSLIAAEDREQFLCMNNIHVAVPASDKVSVELALGLLNSKMMNWFYHTMNPEMGEALAEVKKEHVARLPIAAPSNNNEETIAAIEAIVARLNSEKFNLRNTKDEHSRKIALRIFDSSKKDLNRHVYKLYELTDEDIAIIEADERERNRDLRSLAFC
jgi:type I restriction-modification system DNA methylase subunit